MDGAAADAPYASRMALVSSRLSAGSMATRGSRGVISLLVVASGGCSSTSSGAGGSGSNLATGVGAPPVSMPPGALQVIERYPTPTTLAGFSFSCRGS